MKAMKRNMNWVSFVLFSIVFACACGSDDAGSSSTSNSSSNNAQDMGGDGMSDDTDTQDLSVCEPLEMCPLDSCGAVDDGCGGELDCGVCECEEGEPVEQRCGPCELGTTVCTSETDATCELPAIAEGATDCDDFIFVRSGTGLGNGMKLAPYNTLEEALTQASDGSRILVAAGDGYQESIVVKEGVDISGAFRVESGQWTYDETFQAEFVVSASQDTDVIGVLVEGIDGETHLRNLDIETEDAPTGMNNYGVLVNQSPGLVLANVTVRVGRGGDGEPGEPGEPGAVGNSGFEGGTAAAGDSICGNNAISNFRGGVGGGNSACPSAVGGRGGNGARQFSADAQTGRDATSGARGGEGGGPIVGSGDKGDNGAPVAAIAASGANGSSSGRVENGRWIPEGDGTDGQDGVHGNGGAGGGGAHFNPGASQALPKTAGASGGGGGAGGCGGTAGTGGTGGGGAFGLFVVDSSIVIDNSAFNADAGGLGGEGRAGGPGGQGREGGQGQSTMCGEAISASGAGGNGSAGQTGGTGGGGAGGVSYGAFCVQSRPVLTNVMFNSRGSASGGAGAGGQGEAGVSTDQFRCE